MSSAEQEPAEGSPSPQTPKRPRIDVKGITYVYPPGYPTSSVHELMPHMRFIGSIVEYGHGKASPHFSESPIGFGRIAACAGFLGALGTLHACLAAYGVCIASTVSPLLLRWSYYGISMVTFHTLEFVLTAAYNPRTATAESFLLNHSSAYKIAAMAAWVEFAVEAWAFPSLKSSWVTLVVGALMVTAGQIIRTTAMATAKSNFTHQVSNQKQREHRLVTNGLYTYLRHPSYFGWFWWSVGTQVLLANPVCLVAYFAASWKFFADRIPHEEQCLERFFPDEYPAYRAKTAVGIPFIR